MIPQKTPLRKLNLMNAHGFARVVGPVFEHSPWVAERAFAKHPFKSMDDLHAKLVETMKSASDTEKLALLRAHPDLVGRMAQPQQLTEESKREQAAAGLDRLSSDERELLKIILMREGADIQTVGSVEEGLKTLASWRPQVLISDISMPLEDGYSFIKRVRGLDDRVSAAVPAIALTARARIEDKQRALDAGFDYHVGKPFDRARLIAAVGAAAELALGARRTKSLSPARGNPL